MIGELLIIQAAYSAAIALLASSVAKGLPARELHLMVPRALWFQLMEVMAMQLNLLVVLGLLVDNPLLECLHAIVVLDFKIVERELTLVALDFGVGAILDMRFHLKTQDSIFRDAELFLIIYLRFFMAVEGTVICLPWTRSQMSECLLVFHRRLVNAWSAIASLGANEPQSFELSQNEPFHWLE